MLSLAQARKTTRAVLSLLCVTLPQGSAAAWRSPGFNNTPEYVVNTAAGELASYASYEEYVAAQRAKTDAIVSDKKMLSRAQQAPQNTIIAVAAYIKAHVAMRHRFALCHRTRSGREQMWFRQQLTGVEVLGTKLSEEAAKVAPFTLAWDYHKVKPEWERRTDFVYSNTLDHSFDPALAVRRWMSEIDVQGAVILEYGSDSTHHHASRVDPYSADATQLRAMLRNSSALAVTEGQPPFHLADTFYLPKYSPTFYVLRYGQACHATPDAAYLRNPYVWNTRGAYLFGKKAGITKEFEQRFNAVAGWHVELRASSELRTQYDAVLGTGVQLNELGVQLAPLHLAMRRADNTTAQALLKGAHAVLHHLLQLDRSSSRMARAVWQHYHRNAWQRDWSAACGALHPKAGLAAFGQPILSDLAATGVARVQSFGLDLAALRAQAEDLGLFQHNGSTPLFGAGRNTLAEVIAQQLPALMPLLQNAPLARTMRAYLGSEVRFDGMATADLRANANRRTYDSALWHHDRCGSRFKLYLYTQDVPRRGHPTQVAAGSHTNLWYTYDVLNGVDTSRVTEAFVREHYPVVTLDGPAGGGLLFDTNALHRADPDGDLPRPGVLQFEFHGHGTVSAMQRERASAPCPSFVPGSWGNDVFRRGQFGWEHYPQEGC